MSSNLPLIHRSRRVLPFFINFLCMAERGVNIPPQKIYANSKGGLLSEGGHDVE